LREDFPLDGSLLIFSGLLRRGREAKGQKKNNKRENTGERKNDEEEREKERRVGGERPTARGMVDLEEEGGREEEEKKKIQRFFPLSSITTLGEPRLLGIW